jgi:hypothetical protein
MKRNPANKPGVSHLTQRIFEVPISMVKGNLKLINFRIQKGEDIIFTFLYLIIAGEPFNRG